MNYSTTQTTNLASIIGVVVLILNHFNINIGSDEISALLGGIIAVVGVISNWIHRYKKGDLTFAGIRK